MSLKQTLVLFLVVAAARVNGGSPGTDWVSCKTLGSERCFYTKLQTVTVKIGNKGTNKDVAMEICSDYKKTDCCKTPALKSSLSDDWSKGDTEVWGASYFGPCKNKKFLVKKALVVTLSKNGRDSLNVTEIVIDAIGTEKKKKEPERFICGNFFLGESNLKQTHVCPTGPYEFLKIANATAKIGPDGTDDSVKVKICSDANDICCEHKLSHLLKDDWKDNNTEIWKAKDFGNCKKILYKVNSRPTVSVTKNGKDDLLVKDFTLIMETNDDKPKSLKYECGGFHLKGNCKSQSLCKHTFTCLSPKVKGKPSTSSSGSRRPSSAGGSRRPSSSSIGGSRPNSPSFSSSGGSRPSSPSGNPPGIPSNFQKLDKPFRSTSG